MATKLCDYCNQHSDSSNMKCPYCSAPLNGRIIPNDMSIKETIASAVSESLKKANAAISDGMQNNSAYSYNYNTQNQRTVRGETDRYSYTCSKYITLLLLLVGGIFGIHKFYEGKPGRGILYICTLGFFYIGVILDFFSILGKPYTYPPKI